MFKTGFITIIGRPNAGKSTLINALVGEKVAIVSWRPQTTRNKIVGIMNGDDYQAVFIDTPGIHDGKNQLASYMMKSVNSALDGIDMVIYVVACDKPISDKDVENVQRYANGKTPFILVLNKCDIVEKEAIVKRIEFFSEISGCDNIIPISARTKKSVDILIDEVKKCLKEGEAYYPEDMYTDKDLRFMTQEIIREKALKYLGDEIPYGISVSISSFIEGESGLVNISADIICEKKAHKPIVIGKGGLMLKEISSKARRDIEKLLGQKVFLQVWVKVKEDWRDNDSLLREFGYDQKDLR